MCDREHGQVQAEWQNQDGYETAAELWQMQYFLQESAHRGIKVQVIQKAYRASLSRKKSQVYRFNFLQL